MIENDRRDVAIERRLWTAVGFASVWLTPPNRKRKQRQDHDERSRESSIAGKGAAVHGESTTGQPMARESPFGRSASQRAFDGLFES